MENKSLALGYIHDPKTVNIDLKGFPDGKFTEEKAALKKDFEGLNIYDSDNPEVSNKLKAFARKVVEVMNDTLPVTSLIDVVLPRIESSPGITFERHEIGGLRITESTYGASARTYRPTLTSYNIITNPKEAGITLVFENIESGKYSASEIGAYAANLIGAYRNKLIFDTFIANASFQSGGTQYVASPTLSASFGDLNSAFDKLTDEAEPKVIVGRRSAIQRLSQLAGYSNDTKRDFETKGQVGTYAGVPVLRVSSWQDPTYGTIYPFGNNELWLFSSLPAGAFAVSREVTSSSDIVFRSGRLEIINRWDDAAAVWKPKRAVRLAEIT